MCSIGTYKEWATVNGENGIVFQQSNAENSLLCYLPKIANVLIQMSIEGSTFLQNICQLKMALIILSILN